MNLRKFAGSKKIFWLIFTPIIIIESIVYSEYLDGINKPHDGCDWVRTGNGCKSYLDYISRGSFGGWELHIMAHLLFVLATLLLLASVYFLANKKNKLSFFSFSLLMALAIWYFVTTGWF